MSTFVADIETKALIEENLLSETAKAEEASAWDGENDPWGMWGLSKKSTKKKKAKKRDTSCHNASPIPALTLHAKFHFRTLNASGTGLVIAHVP